MCTVTYLPTEPTGYILTHSRDEKAIRPVAKLPRTVDIGGVAITFPQDPQGQGTWMASGFRDAESPVTVCLLNGAFTAHRSAPPYRHSRGLVPLHVFTYPSVEAFIGTYDFTGLEPLTLLIAEEGRLIELRWNGNRLFVAEKDPGQPYIWSSATLYTPEVIRQREGWFREWCQQHPDYSVEAIRRFHQVGGTGDAENNLRMNRRNEMLTVSLTSVVYGADELNMIYEDFTQPTVYQTPIDPIYATR
ncbi:hypothetical protein [Spirosoma aerolatum]|uniref:hypothetical protein n=1 Tax=Spirosoma aerolatum TaxID=1211326 RepID=UPI0009AEEDE7|nr:hypothetical protein [Spirosoma aerolatum]